MTIEARYDIVAIGNAIVDVIAKSTDEFLEEEQLAKGSMTLIDAGPCQGTISRHGTSARD